MKTITAGIFNDSFPPQIDGVANVAVNYARIINEKYGRAVVAAPQYPGADDNYPFEVLRYPSTYLGKNIGYRAGNPFDLRLLKQLEKSGLDIIHSHSPFSSAVLARILRSVTDVPVVFTYHTKFDVDFARSLPAGPMRKASTRFILNNIKACDEVWVVSEGAGENLRSIGYDGDYYVMKNGVDFKRGRSENSRVEALRKQHGIPKKTPVFLFVGRMMWYKGIKLSLDGLCAARAEGQDFRFVLVGEGHDLPEIKKYAVSAGLADRCIFAGAVEDRELLRDYFSMSRMFLFPSTFDTNGIVVREAAACGVPSVTIKDSCAAEEIEHKVTGLLIDNDVCSMKEAVMFGCKNKAAPRRMGLNASARLYYSWDDAVAAAFARYLVIIEEYRHKDGASKNGRSLGVKYGISEHRKGGEREKHR